MQQSQARPLPFVQDHSSVKSSAAANSCQLAAEWQMKLDKYYVNAKLMLIGFAKKIEAQEKKCIAPRIEEDLQAIRFQRQKIVLTHGPKLANLMKQEKAALDDLQAFKQKNKITREARYPSSQLLSIGILMMLILIEAAINSVLFAETSNQGLIGGWLEASILSLTNIGASFLFGYLILPQMHRRQFLVRLAVLPIVFSGFAVLIAINLFGAHYRDYKANVAKSETSALQRPSTNVAASTIVTFNHMPTLPIKKKSTQSDQGRKSIHNSTQQLDQVLFASVLPSENATIAKILASPFHLESFASIFLCIIGLCGAVIAVVDGYKFDDPIPGFGERDRRYIALREQTGHALQIILAQSNHIVNGSFQKLSQKIEIYAQEITQLQSLHHAYDSERNTHIDHLEEMSRKGEEELSWKQRATYKLPSMNDGVALATSVLPKLNEEHKRLRDQYERKLSSLQKSSVKEQNSVLHLFEEASHDFQDLLNTATERSLKQVKLAS